MTITKEIWRERWLTSINELTDIELQKKSWLDFSNKNPHWSFVEFNCVYFDEILADFDYAHYLEIRWINSNEYDIIYSWHDELDKYFAPDGDHYNHEIILKDKNWLDIVKLGLKTKKTLINILKLKEREILMNKISYP
jgi:hypothetical protein